MVFIIVKSSKAGSGFMNKSERSEADGVGVFTLSAHARFLMGKSVYSQCQRKARSGRPHFGPCGPVLPLLIRLQPPLTTQHNEEQNQIPALALEFE